MWLRLSFLFLLMLLQPVIQAAAGEEGKFLGGKETVYPGWFKESFLDIREDVQEAADDSKRVLLFFHQNGCPYCNLMVQRNLSQKDIQEEMKAKLDVIEVNMWGDRSVVGMDGKDATEKAFAAALKVQFTPTLLFLDETGRVILRLNGYIPPHSFKVALAYVNGHNEQSITYRKFVAANRPAKSAGKLNTENFFSPVPYDLSKGNQPVALFFEQKQCPNCDLLHREVLSDKSVRSLANQFDSIQLDMWSDTPVITPDGREITARRWAEELKISYAPTVVLFDREYGEVIRSEAMFKRFHSASIFDYVLSGSFRHEPSFQRYLSERADKIREKGADVDIWR